MCVCVCVHRSVHLCKWLKPSTSIFTAACEAEGRKRRGGRERNTLTERDRRKKRKIHERSETDRQKYTKREKERLTGREKKREIKEIH